MILTIYLSGDAAGATTGDGEDARSPRLGGLSRLFPFFELDVHFDIEGWGLSLVNGVELGPIRI